MIHAIEVRDLVVISRAELDPAQGLTVITGESGAGKTVVAHALELLTGGAVDRTAVRPGARQALVQATLALPDGFWDDLPLENPAAELRETVEDEREVVIARRIPAEGRARALVDGQVAATAGVAALARAVMHFSGQHEHRRLVSPAAQLVVLDRFAGPEATALAADLRRHRREIATIDAQIAEGSARRAEAARQKEHLESVVEEISAAGLAVAERDELVAERDRLRHSERLTEAAAGAAEALSPEGGDGGAVETIGAAERRLAEMVEVDARLAAPAEELRTAQSSAQEAAIALRSYLNELEAEPGRLAEIEERLGVYADIERRYGPGLEEVLVRLESARAALTKLASDVEDDERLSARRAKVHSAAKKVAKKLDGQRRRAAPQLEEGVAEELEALAMEAARVRVALEPDGADPPALGCTMWLQANPGLPEAPLAESASGGELSRVLLALHGVAAAADEGAWIFDEVDAGIGGVTATAVAQRLARLAQTRQVVVITHLPQVAAVADRHYRLVKEDGSDGIATTAIEPIEGDALVAELCRMLGATPEDEGARRHALELLSTRIESAG